MTELKEKFGAEYDPQKVRFDQSGSLLVDNAG